MFQNFENVDLILMKKNLDKFQNSNQYVPYMKIGVEGLKHLM